MVFGDFRKGEDRADVGEGAGELAGGAVVVGRGVLDIGVAGRGGDEEGGNTAGGFSCGCVRVLGGWKEWEKQ